MAWGGLVLSLVLVFLAVGVLLLTRRWQRQSGLPDGDIIYANGDAWYQNSEVLTDTALRLAGKPDYLVEQADGSIVPVEVKSSAAPGLPYPGHVLQLIAYCRLVEAAFGERPTHGILQYRDRAFSIAYSPALEQDLVDALREMGRAPARNGPDRQHQDAGRCRGCGYRSICDQSLD